MSRLLQWKETHVTVKEVPLSGGQAGRGPCDSSYAYVYAGHGETDASGLWSIRLSAVTCDPPGPRHDSIPSVVATPTFGMVDDSRGALPPPPAFLVALVLGDDISIHSFAPGGERTGNVPFSWHCVVEGELVK